MAKTTPEQNKALVLDTLTRMLLEAPILPTLLRLAAPNMAVMFVQMSIGLVAIYFVARLGTDALAGVSLVFPILSLVGALSQGAVGGGVVTAIARAIGRGERAQASELVWYALAIAVGIGMATTLIVVGAGPRFYQAMGAEGASLATAIKYSNLIFAGSVLVWVFNLLLAAVRGTGNLTLPLIVVCGGALLLWPLSPALIFGFGPFPALGVEGGAAAILAYYGGGSLCFALYLWGRLGVLHPPIRPPRMTWAPFREILSVGGMSAVVSSTTNLTIAGITLYVGQAGVSALAGYGAGARLEFILVSLCYGLGGPAGIMIGTNIGARQARRALRTAWMTVLLTACLAEAVGIAVAIWPNIWMNSFSADPAVTETGVAYLRIVGPFYGFFGIGYALYCVGQGTKHMGWQVFGATARAVIAVVGGFIVVHTSISLEYVFVAVSFGMLGFGCLSLPSLALRLGFSATNSDNKRSLRSGKTATLRLRHNTAAPNARAATPASSPALTSWCSTSSVTCRSPGLTASSCCT
jgi:Na+-driven multidrug efflux pump